MAPALRAAATADYGQAGGAGASSSSAATNSTLALQTHLASYEALEEIGRGTFGLIRKVRRVSDGRLFARKELLFARMSDRDRRQIVNEVNILRSLTHQNIVRYEERCVDNANGVLYIVMEYCQGGDLGKTIKACLKQKRRLPEEAVVSYLAQLVQGLDACHTVPPDSKGNSRVILHRDLKPENIFLDGEQTIKIGDFGLSKEVAQHTFCCTYVGTPYYMSPELAAGAHYDVKSDIWALGCVAYELCGLRPPFDATTQAELTRKIQLGHVPELPPDYSRVLGDMIRGMLQLDPSKRPTTSVLLKHPLIRQAIRKRDEARSTSAAADDRRNSRTAALRQREIALDKRQAELDQREANLKEREERTTQAEEEMRIVQIEWQVRQEALDERERALAAAMATANAARINVNTAVTGASDSVPLTAPTAAAVPASSSSASVQTNLSRERSSRREWTAEQNVAAASLRRLATRRSSAASTVQRMHSSPCVVMGPSLMDSSDISMRDASSWMGHNTTMGGAYSAPLSSSSGAGGEYKNKENNSIGAGPLRLQSTPLRSRRSSPSKLSTAAAAAAAAASAHPLPPPPPRSMAPAPFSTADDESLPSPFLRKIVRTYSQPASSPPRPMRVLNGNHLAAAAGDAMANTAPTGRASGKETDDQAVFESSDDEQAFVSTQHTRGGGGAISMARQAVEHAAREAARIGAAAATTTTTSRGATASGAAPEGYFDEYFSTSSRPSASSSSSSAANSRRLSALPRRRQSMLPGSVGVAPLGRKSGEAIRA